MQTAGQQAALDLHQLAIDRTDDAIAAVEVQLAGIDLGQLNVFVEVALACGLDHGIDDLDAAGALTQLLVGAHQFAQLLQTLVETGVFGRRGQVADGFGIAPTLGDGGFRWVVGGVVVEVRQGADQRVGVAGLAHAHLLTGHELQGAVGAEVQHRVSTPDLLEIGVVGGEAVVGAGAAGVQQPHRVTLVAKGGLNADEDVAEVATEDQQVGAVAVQVAGGLAPVLLEALRVGREAFVFLNAHPVGDGQLRCTLEGLGVLEDRLHQLLGVAGQTADVVALGAHLFHHAVDGAEDVQVGRGADVALVGGEAEDGDCQLLVTAGLDPQGGPTDGPFGNGIHPVLQGVGLAGGVIAAGEHDRLDCAVELGDGDLKGHLNRVQTQVALFPLLSGLEDQGQRHHVGAIELLEDLNCLGVVLASRAADQGEAGQGDHAIHEGLVGVQRVIEEGIDRLGEVQAAAEDGDDCGAPELQFLDDGDVVGLIAGDDVAALKHQADHGPFAGFVAQVLATGIPVEVLLEVLEHRGRQGVPDAQVGEDLGISHLDLGTVLAVAGEDVLVRQHQQEVPEVVRGTAQPVLEAEHEGAGVLRLLHRQVLQHRRQGVEQLQHGVLEPGAAGLLALFHEAGDGRLALTELGHREAAQLVQAHHLRHGGEDHSRLQSVAVGSHRIDHLLGQVFDENQGGDEDIGLSDIGAEVGVVLRVSKLFDQIAAQINGDRAIGVVEGGGCLGQRVLVLGLQNHIDRFHHGPAIHLRGADAAGS